MASGLFVERRCSEGLGPQPDSRAMPYKPWQRAFVDTEHTIDMIVFYVNYLALLVGFTRCMSPIVSQQGGICKGRGPHLANNLIVRLKFAVNVCLVVANLATFFASNFLPRVWSHVFMVFEDQCPKFCGNVHVGLMEHFPFVFVHVFGII